MGKIDELRKRISFQNNLTDKAKRFVLAAVAQHRKQVFQLHHGARVDKA